MGDIHTCRFGVNYTPSEIWWYCWNDFRPASIARDLDTIAAIGADHIRIMARWPYFQPNPTWVSPAPLERLDQVLALAQERGLDVCVAMLNGHLTGQNFRQGYEGGRSFFSDPLLLAAQRQYFAAVAETIGGRENFLGFDLGNELNCCWCTEDLAEGDRWFGETMDLVERLLPAAVHVNGLDHQPWFRPHTFTPAGQAQRQSIVPLHCWIHFTGALQRGGPTLEPVVRLAEAMTALVRGYAEDSAKPVWVQEYGASEEWMDAAQIPHLPGAGDHRRHRGRRRLVYLVGQSRHRPQVCREAPRVLPGADRRGPAHQAPGRGLSRTGAQLRRQARALARGRCVDGSAGAHAGGDLGVATGVDGGDAQVSSFEEKA